MRPDTGLPDRDDPGQASVTDDPDVQLMLQFQQGNEGAFVQLYERHRDRVFNVGRRLLGARADGEEVAQDVFLKLYQTRAQYKPLSRFNTYILRIAINHSLNVKARHERSRRDPQADVQAHASASAATPETLTQHLRLQQSVAQALAKLPDKQAAALVLCHFEGHTCRAAAEILEVSEGAVKQLVFRARSQLAQTLLAHHPDAESP